LRILCLDHHGGLILLVLSGELVVHIAEQFLAKGTLVCDCKIKKNYFMIFKNARKLLTKIILLNTSMKKCKT